jgi:hypothetical protein
MAAGGRRGSAESLTFSEVSIVEALKEKVRTLCTGLYFISCSDENNETYFDTDQQLRDSFANFFGVYSGEHLQRFNKVVGLLSIDDVEIVRLNSEGMAFDPAYGGVDPANIFATTRDNVIYLGDLFFQANPKVQVLTLLHELTHACAGTEDFGLHARSTKPQIVDFARKYPDAALKTAYCCEAFADENFDLLVEVALAKSESAGSDTNSCAGSTVVSGDGWNDAVESVESDASNCVYINLVSNNEWRRAVVFSGIEYTPRDVTMTEYLDLDAALGSSTSSKDENSTVISGGIIYTPGARAVTASEYLATLLRSGAISNDEDSTMVPAGMVCTPIASEGGLGTAGVGRKARVTITTEIVAQSSFKCEVDS